MIVGSFGRIYSAFMNEEPVRDSWAFSGSISLSLPPVAVARRAYRINVKGCFMDRWGCRGLSRDPIASKSPQRRSRLETIISIPK